MALYYSYDNNLLHFLLPAALILVHHFRIVLLKQRIVRSPTCTPKYVLTNSCNVMVISPFLYKFYVLTFLICVLFLKTQNYYLLYHFVLHLYYIQGMYDYIVNNFSVHFLFYNNSFFNLSFTIFCIAA